MAHNHRQLEVIVYLLKAWDDDNLASTTVFSSSDDDDDSDDNDSLGVPVFRQQLTQTYSCRFDLLRVLLPARYYGLEEALLRPRYFLVWIRLSWKWNRTFLGEQAQEYEVPSPILDLLPTTIDAMFPNFPNLPKGESSFSLGSRHDLIIGQARSRMPLAEAFFQNLCTWMLQNPTYRNPDLKRNDMADIARLIEATTTSYRYLGRDILRDGENSQLSSFYHSLGGPPALFTRALDTFEVILRGDRPRSLRSIYSFIHVSLAMQRANSASLGLQDESLVIQSEIDVFRRYLSPLPDQSGSLSPRHLFDQLMGLHGNAAVNELPFRGEQRPTSRTSSNLRDSTTLTTRTRTTSVSPARETSIDPPRTISTSRIFQRFFYFIIGFSVTGIFALWACMRNFSSIESLVRSRSRASSNLLSSPVQATETFLSLLSGAFNDADVGSRNKVALLYESILIYLMMVIDICRRASASFHNSETILSPSGPAAGPSNTHTPMPAEEEAAKDEDLIRLLQLKSLLQHREELRRSQKGLPNPPLVHIQSVPDVPMPARLTKHELPPISPSLPPILSKLPPLPPLPTPETKANGVAKSYICQVCSNSWKSIPEFLQHVRTMHSRELYFRCHFDGCKHSALENSFATEEALKAHLEEHVNPTDCEDAAQEYDIRVGECATTWAERTRRSRSSGNNDMASQKEISLDKSGVESPDTFENFETASSISYPSSLEVEISQSEEEDPSASRPSKKRKRWSSFSGQHVTKGQYCIWEGSANEATRDGKRQKLSSVLEAIDKCLNEAPALAKPHPSRSSSTYNVPPVTGKRKATHERVNCDEENCGESFASKSNLDRHKRQKHRDLVEVHTCKYPGCNSRYTGDRGFLHLRDHQLREHGETHLHRKRRKF